MSHGLWIKFYNPIPSWAIWLTVSSDHRHIMYYIMVLKINQIKANTLLYSIGTAEEDIKVLTYQGFLDYIFRLNIGLIHPCAKCCLFATETIRPIFCEVIAAVRVKNFCPHCFSRESDRLEVLWKTSWNCWKLTNTPCSGQVSPENRHDLDSRCPNITPTTLCSAILMNFTFELSARCKIWQIQLPSSWHSAAIVIAFTTPLDLTGQNILIICTPTSQLSTARL